jgi:hypothetical protein
MAEVANLAFADSDSGNEGFAVVPVEGQLVGLTLSFRNNSRGRRDASGPDCRVEW